MSIVEAVQTTKATPSTATSGMVLQRKCACGGSAGLSGECEGCKTRKLLGKPLQKKLAISEPGDEFEQEADRVAEQVMKMPKWPETAGLSKTVDRPLIQRRTSASSGTNAGFVPPIVHEVLNALGQPLEPELRQTMEYRFGYDFSGVRVHFGDLAERSLRDINAHAYTVGTNVVFGAKSFAPRTPEGCRLLAHELTHVVQQSRGGVAPRIGGDTALERDADSAADSFVDNLPIQVRGASGVGIARAPKTEPKALPAETVMYEVDFPDGKRRLTVQEFEAHKARAIQKLRIDLKHVSDLAEVGRQSQIDMLKEYHGGVETLRDVYHKPKALIGIASDIWGKTNPPYIGMWSAPTNVAVKGQDALDRGDLKEGARMLRLANQHYRDAMHEWNTYREKTIGGAESLVSDLEIIRDVSFAVALAAGAAVAAPAIAAVAGGGALGAGGTALGTAAVTGAGGAALGGGSTALASYTSTGKVNVKAVKKDALKFGKEGVVTGLTAGLGSSLNIAAKAGKLAQPLVQTAAKRCLTESGVNVAGEVTAELIDRVTAPEEAQQEQEGGPKPLVPGPARAALTGCLSGVLGVPVAKLGHVGTKATELATTAAVGYADARLQGQSNEEALIAAGQGALTSAAIGHGHAGSERTKAAKATALHVTRTAAGTSQESSAVPATHDRPTETPRSEKPPELTNMMDGPSKSVHEPNSAKLQETATRHEAAAHESPPASKLFDQQKPATGQEGPPAVLKEEAKAKAPLGDGHDVIVTEHGLGKCSASPCPVIRVAYAKELQEHPWANKRYKEIEALRKSSPDEAVKAAARFVKVLEMLKAREGKAAAPAFKEPAKEGGSEVFGEVTEELGLEPVKKHPGGIRQSVADAEAAGFIKSDGSPGTISAAFQPHGSASTVRDELGLTGAEKHSAHIGPTSALRKLSGYSRSEALTLLLPPETHAAFDAHWKEWAKAQRRAGEASATIAELHRVMVDAIEQTPNLSKETKGAMAWQLQLELYRDLSLKPGDRIDLPYANISSQ